MVELGTNAPERADRTLVEHEPAHHGTTEPAVPVRTDAPPLAPLAPAVDRAHLAQMTQGEADLEREVLRLFATQAEILLGRMHEGTPAFVGAIAHTLAGSAQSVGAWKFAEAASAVEAAAVSGCDMTAGMARLAAAAREAQVEIADLLRD